MNPSEISCTAVTAERPHLNSMNKTKNNNVPKQVWRHRQQDYTGGSDADADADKEGDACAEAMGTKRPHDCGGGTD